MAFTDPVQLILLAVIVIVIFLWGPQKIPELARALGRARKEFDQASKELTNPGSTALAPTGTPAPNKTGDEALMNTARQLGITTEGKTREQISDEIVKRVKDYA
jgi:sec-independent protein translocase protein TatA